MSGKTLKWISSGAAAVFALGILWWSVGGSGDESAPRSERGEESAENLASDGDPGFSELRFSPAEGQTLDFEFSLEGTLDVDMGAMLAQATAKPVQAGDRTVLVTEGAGEFHVKFYQADSQTWDVAARLSHVTHQINGQTPAFVPQLDYPFYFQMGSDGKISGISFTEGTGQEARAFLKNVVLSMQISFAEGASQTWDAAQDDATGRYLAKYSAAPGNRGEWDLTRTKAAYLQLHTSDPNTGVQRYTDLGSSEATATFTPGDAWLSSLDDTSSIRQSASGVQLVKGASRLRVQRIAGGPNTVRFPSGFAAFRTDVESVRWARSELYATVPALNRMAHGLDLSGALSLFHRLVDQNQQPDATAFLVNYLRLYPDQAAALAARLGSKKGGAFSKGQGLLWNALAKSGHPEAQRALLSAVSNPKVTGDTRIQAMAYVGDIKFPTEQTVEDVWAQYIEPAGDPQSTEGQLKTMSIFALGTLGNQARLNPEERTEIRDMLVSGVDEADTEWDERMALRAIGNSGNSSLLDVVRPRFDSASGAIRSAAYTALRQMSDPRAQAVLINAYEREPSDELRLKALQILSDMAPITVPTIEWVEAELPRVRSEGELIGLVNVLGKSLEAHRGNEGVLRRLLEDDPSVPVLRAIYDYIAPKR